MRTYSTAWPFAVCFAALNLYASLYPFEGWRDQGLMPLEFLFEPWPKYWTWFDLITNVLAYVPLGFCLALGWLRSQGQAKGLWLWWLALSLMSLMLEATQTYLPVRVASWVDWVLNSLGGAMGLMLALLLQRRGWVMRWHEFSSQWFVPDARGAMVWLGLWPFALLFPVAVPFGLGHVLERLEDLLGEWLHGTPFLEWLPFRAIEPEPLLPAAEVLCMVLGLLIPILVAYAVIAHPVRRCLTAGLVVLVGFFATSLSSGLTFGGIHSLSWFTLPTQVAMVLALMWSAVLAWVSRPLALAFLLLSLVVHLMTLNQSASDVYLVHNLQSWQQNQYIRFNGALQWVGWFWPFGVLVWAMMQWSSTARNR
ncbi:MAG: hypothetical protein RL307_1183 [Pseudomonadota bacterium]